MTNSHSEASAGVTLAKCTLSAISPPQQHYSNVIPASPPRINVDPNKTEQGLVKLVLCLVELLRQLLEKQAIRRMDKGSLSAEEIERVGTTLMLLEKKVKELQEDFGIEDLNMNLGPLGNLLE